MRVLLAFDKFKDALSAAEVTAAVAKGIRAVHPDWVIDLCPLADGGEGFARALTQSARGRWVPWRVTGPLPGMVVEAGFGLVAVASLPPAVRQPFPGEATTLAILDMASASGLALLPPAQRNPWHTTTFGTGELIRAAANAGANLILLGVGGSATHDVGLGALQALGWQARTRGGILCPATPERWSEVLELAPADPRLPPVWVATDVTNPLLGPNGAAAVYAPQKGLPSSDHARLEAATERMALQVLHASRKPDTWLTRKGGGAAGGLAFGMAVGVDATLVSGAALFEAWADFPSRLARADVVLTGEGTFDATSWSGKGPGAVVQQALAAKKRVGIIAGRVRDAERLHGAVAVALTRDGEALEVALPQTAARLTAAAQEWVRRVLGAGE